MPSTRSLINKRYYQKNIAELRIKSAEKQRKWRAENPVEARESDRKKRLAKKARGYKQPSYKRLVGDKERARVALNNAVKLGKVIRPAECSRCFNKGRVEGHHPDYGKPLEVLWLCSGCHAVTHHPLKDVEQAINKLFGIGG